MPSFLSNPKTGFRLLCGLVLGLFCWLVLLFGRGLHLETNILALLPESERDPRTAETADRFAAEMSRQMVFLVSHPHQAKAIEGAEALAGSLSDTGLFEQVNGRIPAQLEREFAALYFPFRYQLLSAKQRANLSQNSGGAWLTAEARKMLYGPLGSVYAGSLEQDPLLLFAGFLQGLPQPPGRLGVNDGWLQAEWQGFHVLISAKTREGAYSRRGHKALLTFLNSGLGALKAGNPGLVIRAAGMPRYAALGAKTAEGEISTIGTGSLLGVVLLFLVVFRSSRVLLLGLLPIVTGLLAAMAVCFTVFERVHLMTLGFGASLIGICIDYTFHYFCERLAEKEPKPTHALRAILPGISLGAFTSILAYLGLMAAPFPGLRQMAVFSAVGLAGAYLAVVLGFPFLLAQRFGGWQAGPRLSQSYLGLWLRLKPRSAAILVLLLMPVIVLGISRLHTHDDIRALQAPDPDLFAEEQQIREICGTVDASRFLVVRAADIESLLRLEETVSAALTPLIDAGDLAYIQRLSSLLPSRQRQMADARLLSNSFINGGSSLNDYFRGLAFQDEVTAAFKNGLSSEPAAFLEFDQWLKSPVSAPLRFLWQGDSGPGAASVMLLGGLADESGLRQKIGNLTGVTFVDKVADVSSLMTRYRVLSSRLVLAAYLLIAWILLWRYGLSKGWRVLLPPCAAALLVLAMYGFLQIPITLINMMALLLVLGIGIDYTVFFAEAKSGHGRTMFAIMLAAATTVLSFGLLALSEVAVLRQFGLTVLMGIGFAWLLSPIAALKDVP